MTRRAGQIRKRGDQKWLVTIYLGTHPDTGKRIYESKTIRGTKAVAEKALRKLLTRRDLGELHAPSRVPLSEYLDRWISDAVEDRVRPRTLQDYRRFLEPVRSRLGARPLNKVTPVDIQQLLKELPSAHGARRTHAVLRTALRQAVRWGYIATSPIDGVQAPREPHTEMLALSAAQARAFRQAAKSVPRGFLFVFSMATGMRPGEVQGLRWEDCDLDAGIVRVERSIAWIDGKPDKRTGKRGKVWKLGEPKTRLSRRTIPLPDSIATDLRAWRRQQLKWRLKLKRAYNDHGFVFAGELGEPIRNSNLSRRVLKPILKSAELPEDIQKRFRWYDCRHTCATLLLEAGVNAKIVSERLGHSTVAFTLDRYAHVLPGQQEQASSALDRLMNE